MRVEDTGSLVETEMRDVVEPDCPDLSEDNPIDYKELGIISISTARLTPQIETSQDSNIDAAATVVVEIHNETEEEGQHTPPITTKLSSSGSSASSSCSTAGSSSGISSMSDDSTPSPPSRGVSIDIEET